ncbi:MAG: TolC family protein [Gemmatimonadales bacterium]
MTNASRGMFAGLVVWGLAAGAASGQTKPTLTLTEAIERAERVQPRVIQAAGALRNADARVRSAKGAYLPNFNVSSSAGEFYSEGQRIDPSTGQLVPTNSSNTSLNGSLNSSIELFDGFRRSAESRSARANRESATESLEDARYQQQLQTTNQYFDVLAAIQLARVREAGVRRADEQLRASIARLRAGAAIRSDSLRSLVTLGNARVQLINAQTQLATAEANLGRLVGADGPATAADDSSYYRVLTELDTTALRVEALNRSPQVRLAEANARSARASVNVARSGYWPTLVLAASNSLNGSEQNDYRFLQQRQATLTVNWAVFNRFTREQNIAQQRSSAETADANAGEARRLILANLTTRLAELDAARTRIGIAQTSLAAATEDLRVQQERYRLGVATIVDVVTSQESLAQAEVDAVTARFDYLRAKAQIQALIGRQL